MLHKNEMMIMMLVGFFMVPPVGFEPTTSGLKARHSAVELWRDYLMKLVHPRGFEPRTVANQATVIPNSPGMEGDWEFLSLTESSPTQ